ncbi:hypothetical protein [Aquicella lusitana]|uniref:DUF4440 domain-containing protein n=1 Tax=Aquicella lusitana TaxID=254246 RepID=A0A370GME4_9COXI|nr:hypothetical protein [Aquicella lusitana]RDI44540.1 hypothetical protein C8D86_10922 [Aquicella lusitana]VVC72518.1 hypothetical protein AQULUS_02300 [Aquicella lusitana]
MYRRLSLLPLLLISMQAAAVKPADYKLFENIFTHWTAAFNQKKWPESCHLFSKSLVADYQGYPQKSYDTVCNGFKKVFQETEKDYHYRFKLRDVYRNGNLAAVRITWFLDISENNKNVSSTRDEGIDILQKQSSGEWKIVNYLGYPVK